MTPDSHCNDMHSGADANHNPNAFSYAGGVLHASHMTTHAQTHAHVAGWLACIFSVLAYFYLSSACIHKDKCFNMHQYSKFSSSQLQWLSSTTTTRFSYPQCAETRTWVQLAHEYKDDQKLLTTGGLGPSQRNAQFKTWACFKGHDCLFKLLKFPYTDAMCYVYHEIEKRWYPWALQSEISQLCI